MEDNQDVIEQVKFVPLFPLFHTENDECPMCGEPIDWAADRYCDECGYKNPLLD